MASGYTKMIVTGYLAKDVYFQDKKKDGTPLERPFAKVRLLFTPYVGKDKQAQTIAYDVLLNGNDAITANKYLKKSSHVLIEAEPRSLTVAIDKETNKPIKTQAGEYIINFELEGKKLQLLDRKGDNVGGESDGVMAHGGVRSSTASAFETEEEAPF